ncbi:hypothetical protein E4T43_04781 [Aureobasidium subglaciale]|nr:hypothetical protein E4T43_04781 [Aureobasidium subglaciale]
MNIGRGDFLLTILFVLSVSGCYRRHVIGLVARVDAKDTTRARTVDCGIPHPPTLPSELWFGDGYKKPDWSRDAVHWAAADNSQGGFKIRMGNINDPIGEGKRKSPDWPVQYWLGQPSFRAGWQELHQKWGLRVLEKAGLLNARTGGHDPRMKPVGNYAKVRNPSNDLHERVHPVFRRDMWDTTDEIHQAIKPALLLASAFLDDVTTLSLFYALSPPSCITSFCDPELGSCTRVNIPDTLTVVQQHETFTKLCQMRKWTHFYWGDPQKLIKTRIGMNALVYSMYQKYNRSISGDSEYRAFLDGVLTMSGATQDRKPDELDPASVSMRMTLLFATTLVHEFAHAFSNAFFEQPDQTPPLPNKPWLADNRSNELGHATI